MAKNQAFLSVCLRYEFLRGKSVFETYKSLCETLGNDVMEYKDFEFWFYRFVNGNFDMNYDRSLDPPAPSLSDMEMNVIEKIVDKLKWKERMIFRKTSKKNREAVDARPYNYKEIHFRVYKYRTLLSFDDALVQYIKEKDGCRVEFEYKEHKLEGENYVNCALIDLISVVKNSEVHVENFIVSIGFNNEKAIEDAFKALNHQINVKNFKMKLELRGDEDAYCDDYHECNNQNDYEYGIVDKLKWKNMLRTKRSSKNSTITGLEEQETQRERNIKQEKVMSILPYLNPNELETIQIDSGLKNTRYSAMKIDKIVELEQWKQTKILKMPKLLVSIPIENYNHFNLLEARITSISIEDVTRLKDEYLNNPNFEYCELSVKKSDDIKSALDPRFFPIPNSNDKLKMEMNKDCIIFKIVPDPRSCNCCF